jgi:hypothetical protein
MERERAMSFFPVQHRRGQYGVIRHDAIVRQTVKSEDKFAVIVLGGGMI